MTFVLNLENCVGVDHVKNESKEKQGTEDCVTNLKAGSWTRGSWFEQRSSGATLMEESAERVRRQAGEDLLCQVVTLLQMQTME